MNKEVCCENKDIRVCYKLQSNGVKRYVEQCFFCGYSNNNCIKHADVPSEYLDLEFRAARYERFIEREMRKRQQEWELKRDREKQEFFVDYNVYLKSPEWQHKRKIVLERDDYTCQGCLVSKARKVHHLTYTRIYNELAYDLISLCTECHNIAHDK